MLTSDAVHRRNVRVSWWWAQRLWAHENLKEDQIPFVAYCPSMLADQNRLTWNVMVTERVVHVAIAWLEPIYTRYRMFRLPPAIIKGILDLDFHACVALGCERNLAGLQLLTVLMTTVPWDALPASFVEDRAGTSAANAIPSGAQYVGFCVYNRVFIADTKITDEFRVK